MSIVCQVCDRSFETEKSLHGHLKAHKMSMEAYYHTYYPRYDLWTGNLINFTTKEKYIRSHFNQPSSFRKWLKEKATMLEAQNISRELILAWTQEKGIDYLPCEVELISRRLPTLDDLILTFGTDQKDIATKLHLARARLDVIGSLDFKIQNDLKIFIDTREQKPLGFPDSRRMALSVGDYTCAGDNYCDVFIERKSLSDLAGTVTSGIVRFTAEIVKAAELNHYLVVVVECPLQSVMTYISKFGQRLTGDHILHPVRELIRKFPHIQFVFVDDRFEATQAILTILSMGEKAKTIDLQYYYNHGMVSR